ncbi:MAG: tetratricopeptide repeat protein [Pirellulales bacterium]|nr:tetratricopeptide repeat protein [Pirellulales bacterium]
MKRRRIALSVAIWLAATAVATAMDTIRTEQRSYSGTLAGMTSQDVTVERLGDKNVVPVNQITAVLFDSEPPQLNVARNAIEGGRYEDAQTALDKIDLSKVQRPEIRQDIQFYRSLSAAKLALRGVGTIPEAGKLMVAFVTDNPNNYHWLEASELVGDLLVANRQYAKAIDYYTNVGKAPWPEYRMRADVAIGQALLADGKALQAAQAFDRVFLQEAKDKAGKVQRLFAELGLAQCLTAQGKTDEAIKRIQKVILELDPENVPLSARAYNALGTVYRKAGKPQDALLAFLHVDLLYFASAEDHAEALANLAELWNEVHKPERAAQAQRLLKERYKNSRWASR